MWLKEIYIHVLWYFKFINFFLRCSIFSLTAQFSLHFISFQPRLCSCLRWSYWALRGTMNYSGSTNILYSVISANHSFFILSSCAMRECQVTQWKNVQTCVQCTMPDGWNLHIAHLRTSSRVWNSSWSLYVGVLETMIKEFSLQWSIFVCFFCTKYINISTIKIATTNCQRTNK